MSSQWSPQEEVVLTMMIAMGATHAEIALRLGRKEAHIQRKASRLGVLKRERAQEARRLAEESRLEATEDDLSEFLPAVEEEPHDDRAERRRAANRVYAEANRDKIREHQRKRYATDEKYRAKKKGKAA